VTINEHITFWLDQSTEDLNTAFKMLESRIFDWALFVGHLSLEKVLKAKWIEFNKNSNPPKIHNLVTLADKSGIILTKEQIKNYLTINNFHLEARYQNYKDDFKKIANKEFSEKNLQIIRNEHIWIKSQLK
jgi:HEPN domain-containing protein